tara:strand:- start:796 stop:2079 length:1284 start_codon:yes stop_codon:yes gene_type:complete
MIRILTTIHTTPNIRTYRTHSFENIFKSLSKNIEVQIIWLVYKPEKIDVKKYSNKNNIVLDIHDFKNAVDVIKKIQPNIIWAAPTLNLPDFALSIAGKKLGIPVVGEIVTELFIKDDKFEIFKTYLGHFFEQTVPTDISDGEKRFMRRGRFFMYKFLFLLKTQKKAGWKFFKILKYIFILIKAHITVYENLHDPRFSCNVHFVETEKLINQLIKKGYNKNNLIVTGIPMYDSAAIEIKKLEKNKINSSKKNVLLLTHAMYEHGIWTKEQRNSLIKKVVRELSQKGNYNIIIKIHPSSEQLSDYESIVHNIDKSIKIIQHGDILEYIVNSDVIVTYSGSSSLVYALMCNKPIIICDFYNLKNDIFIDGKVSISCKNEKEIVETIENMDKELFVKKEDLEKFTKEYFHKLDGKASERIASELLKIVQRE